ncbi:MAG: helix-turn-helix transcriptional regulator [Oscillospiraceae bacterium]|nr:helix-turn-helix transcriptional regulator [Oscillospiraceae bacterium]
MIVLGLPADKNIYVETLSVESAPDMSASHIHNYYEIYLLMEGQRRFFINHTLYDVMPYDVVLVNKGDVHLTTCVKENERYTRHLITFNDEFLDSLGTAFDKEQLIRVFDRKKIRIPEMMRNSLNMLVYKALGKISGEDVFDEYTVNLCIIELLINLNKCSASQSSSMIDSISVYEKRIQDVCRYMFNYYNQQITLEQMAKIAYMSPTYFSKKFKSVTGFGFREYLNYIRIKMATDMLMETRYSITEIASFCGYHDSNYFGDVFKRIVGSSPYKYRKEHHLV